MDTGHNKQFYYTAEHVLDTLCFSQNCASKLSSCILTSSISSICIQDQQSDTHIILPGDFFRQIQKFISSISYLPGC